MRMKLILMTTAMVAISTGSACGFSNGDMLWADCEDYHECGYAEDGTRLYCFGAGEDGIGFCSFSCYQPEGLHPDMYCQSVVGEDSHCSGSGLPGARCVQSSTE